VSKQLGNGFDNLDAIKSDGTKVAAVQSGAAKGCTLGVGTYFFPIGGSDGSFPGDMPIAAIHLAWAAAVDATITVETCNFPAHEHGMKDGPADVSDYDTTPGNWIPVAPTNAYGGAAGAGNAVAGSTITAGGTNAGGAMLHLPNIGSRRARVKVVTTVGGLVRCGAHGKMSDG
jgi:hypothetical protein